MTIFIARNLQSALFTTYNFSIKLHCLFITNRMTPTYSQNAEPAIPSLLQKNSLTNPNLIASQDTSALRLSLDTNLEAIYQQIKKTPMKDNQKIPILNSRLVREYIRFVYQQYNIRDPFANNMRLFNLKNTHRKAVHLKESFLIQLLSPSDHNQSIFNYQQLSSKQRSTQLSSPPKKSQRDTQIKQQYRYCFICQEPILETNIEIHEKTRCPQFSNLYDMSVGQLREMLVRKIHKIKSIIESQLRNQKMTGNQTMNGLFSIQNQAIQYINTINENLFQPKNTETNLLASRDQLRYQFHCTMEAFETHYFEIYAQLRKLQWFVNMHFNLQCQYEHILTQSGHVSYSNRQNTEFA